MSLRMNSARYASLLATFGDQNRVSNSVPAEHAAALKHCLWGGLIRQDGKELVLTEEGRRELEEARRIVSSGGGRGSRGGMRMTSLNRFTLLDVFGTSSRVPNRIDPTSASALRRMIKLGVVDVSPNKRELVLTDLGLREQAQALREESPTSRANRLRKGQTGFTYGGWGRDRSRRRRSRRRR